jgi:FkbM family methyltransferase
MVRRRVSTYQPRTVTRRYAGHELCISLRDPLAEGWYDHDWGQQPEIDRLQRGRLLPGARVFDLGAHQGVVALVLSRIVGVTGEVVAVEAERHNVFVANENVRLNGAANLRVLHAAAADRPGRLFFSESLNGNVTPVGARSSVEVDAVTVDELADRFGAPDVVFVDVEGYEAKVLAGARRTLARRSTDFFVEVHDAETLARAGATAGDVVDAFQANGYRCHGTATEGEVTGQWSEITDGSWFAGLRSFLVATATG